LIFEWTLVINDSKLNTIIDLLKDSKNIIIFLVCVLLIYCSLPYAQHAVERARPSNEKRQFNF
jgi:hypothetical protein